MVRDRHVRMVGIRQVEIERACAKPSLQGVTAGDSLRERKKNNWSKWAESAGATQVDRENWRPRSNFVKVLFDRS